MLSILTETDGLAAMILQFVVFPPVARNFGVLNSLKVVTILYPIAYILAPFTVLMPTPMLQQTAIFCVMLIKCLAGVFAFPCTTILLTNSAGSLRLLATLNGVATSISAMGRGSGPYLAGRAFTFGVKVGYVVLAWWLLAAFAVLGHIPCYWLVEMDGFSSKEDNKDKETAKSEDDCNRDRFKQINSLEIKDRLGSDSLLATDVETSPQRRPSTIGTVREETGIEAEHAVSQEVPLSRSRSSSNSRPRRADGSHLSSSSSSESTVSLSTSPVFIAKGIGPQGKGRQLSNNLGLSDGLGRTVIGGGYGTRGPSLS